MEAITLGEWKAELDKLISQFSRYWAMAAMGNSTEFTLKLTGDEWDEQFALWLTTSERAQAGGEL